MKTHTLIEVEGYLVEDLHEVHVVIAVLLDLDKQRELGSSTLTKWKEKDTVLLGRGRYQSAMNHSNVPLPKYHCVHVPSGV